WRPHRDEYITCLLRRAGCLGANEEVCRVCKARRPTARCKECFGDDLLCSPCLVDRHTENPLHHVEIWDGNFFVQSSLKKLGLRVQLGHPVHDRCPEPHPANGEFIVLHKNGIHDVAVDLCDCENAQQAGAPEIQLLRAGWFLATDDKPKTCTTIDMLDDFLIQTLQSTVTMYDYHAALEKLTDNATGDKPPDRYHAFLRMAREYGHLLMLKWAGKGHDLEGVAGTQQGELAI
ncbi:hypothetical protein B0H10DRAFT_1771926, partial [Mycena sp. CBHHK59/15]